MKRQLLVRCIGMGLACCLSWAGCADRNVNYDIDGATEAELSQRGKTGVKQFADVSSWADEWSVITSKGNTVKISIDADITVPAAEQMSVVEVRETVFDEEYKKRMVRQLFGNEEVYYNDISHLTKKELTELRAEYEMLYEAYAVEGLEGEREQFNEKIQECDAALEKAKDTYTPAEDFAVNAYWGSWEGIPYNLSFVEENTINGNSGRQVFLSSRDVYQVCPQKFREIENLTYEAWDPQVHGTLAANSCGLSEEEARKEAQSFVDNIESEYFVYAYSKPLVWGDDENQSEWTAAGYVFYFGFGIDDMAFTEFGTEGNYWNFVLKRNGTEEPQYSLDASMAVYVTDTGVIGATINNPIEAVNISEQMELLSLKDIQGIIKEQLTDHFGTFRFSFRASVGNTVKLDEMELIYFRLRDRKEQGCYSYVPTWRLAGVVRDVYGRITGINNQVLINAIDGSVINVYEEI